MNRRKTSLSASLAVAACLALLALAHQGEAIAQDWPKQTIKLIVPFTAGSGTDVVARAVALRLST